MPAYFFPQRRQKELHWAKFIQKSRLSQSKEYANQTTKWATSIKRIWKPKPNAQGGGSIFPCLPLITCWNKYVNFTPQYCFPIFPTLFWNQLVPVAIVSFRYLLVCHPVFCQNTSEKKVTFSKWLCDFKTLTDECSKIQVEHKISGATQINIKNTKKRGCSAGHRVSDRHNTNW